MEHAVVPPRLFIAHGHVQGALQRRLARPRHPRQKLRPGRDRSFIDARGMRSAHRLEPQATRRKRYSARGGGGDGFAPSVLAGPIQTVWMLVNSLIPYDDSSRPYPERFTPPNGRRASDATMPLMNTRPASTRSASRFPRSTSEVQMLEPSPKSVSLATRRASSASLTRMTAATGPNVSS